MILRQTITTLVIMTATGIASPKLEAARTAIAAVEYRDAHDLLEAAIAEGGNSPSDLTEIYRLAANTAVVLGDHTAAETYFRRWISLDPQATLTSDAAAKFREPFVEAQAFVREHGALRVTVGSHGDQILSLVVHNDALQLARSAGTVADPSARRPLGPRHEVSFHVPNDKAMVHVFVFDEFGNRVFERSYSTFAAVPVAEQNDNGPLYRHWQVWAIPAVVFGGAAFLFHHEVRVAQRELDADEGTRNEIYYDQVLSAMHRRDQDNQLTLGFGIGAGACVLLMGWMYFSPRRTVLTPSISSTGIALVGQRSF
ncbi:MAG: tetratricopeptide repeat protein [Kofleriaceae bacterium]